MSTMPKHDGHDADVRKMLARAYRGEPEAAPYKRRLEYLKSLRTEIEPLFREIQDYALPMLGKFLDGDDSESGTMRVADEVSRRSMILDSSPTNMIRTAADGLHGGITNQGEQFFSYYIGRYNDYEKNFSRESRDWTVNAQECVRDVMASSNFYSAVYQLYVELLCGTCLMLILRDAESYVRYYTKTLGTYWLGKDETGRYDTAYIRHTFRAVDLVRKYGADKCPERVREAVKSGHTDRIFYVMQCIQPWGMRIGGSGRLDYKSKDKEQERKRFQYEDVWFVEGGSDDEKILSRKGYATKPFVAAVWSDAGEKLYGTTSPVIDALPDIKQLQVTILDYNKGVKWKSDPAFMQSTGNEYTSILPGMVYKVSGDMRQNMIAPIQTPDFDLNANFTAAEQIRQRISATLYNREILLVQSRQRSNVTATEVNQLIREAQTVLGPVAARIANSLLIPAIDRTFEIITSEWAMMLPQPPEEISGQEIKPYFTSQLAEAQRQGGTLRKAEYLFNTATLLTQLQSPAVNLLNLDAGIRALDAVEMFPAGSVRTQDEVDEISAQQQAAAQQAQQAAALQQGADVAAKLGGASVSPETALGQVMMKNGMAPDGEAGQ